MIVGTCAPGDPVINQRFQGVTDAFAKDCLPGVSVKGPFDVGFDLAAVSAAAQTLVQANPDALAFMGLCETNYGVERHQGTDGRRLARRGRNINDGTVRGLQNGTIMATVSQNPFMQGYLPIRLLVNHLNRTAIRCRRVG